MTVAVGQNLNNFQFSKRDDLHLARKTWHVAWGIICLALYYFNGWEQRTAAYICLVAAVLAFIFDIVRIKTPFINELSFKVMRPFMRESEVSKISGLPFYALGMGVSLFFFTNEIAVLSILYLIFSDPLSSLFGIIFGEVKLLPGKSLEGSFAGFCVCYCITIIYGKIFGVTTENLIVFSLIAGGIGSLSEFVSTFKIDDNFTIPVLSGLGLTIINNFFGIL